MRKKSKHKTKSYWETIDWDGVFCIAIFWLITIFCIAGVNNAVSKSKSKKK